MTKVPTCLSMALCPPRSRTLRAGSAGGLKAILDRGEHSACEKSGRDEETARFSRTKKHYWQHAKKILHSLTDTTLSSNGQMRTCG